MSFTLYSSVPATTSGQRSPAFYGFSVLDLVNYKESHPGLAELNGKVYATSLLRKVLLYPVQHGKLIIDPIYVEAVTEVFDSLGGGRQNQQKEITSLPVEVNVRPLPVPRPRGFPGAVGKFKISAQAEKESFPLNQQGRLIVALEGRGNFIQSAPPEIDWPDGVQDYEPTIREKLTNTDSGIVGVRIYEFPFSVDSTGIYLIPPPRFSYFDAGIRNFVTLQAGQISIQAIPAQTIKEIAVTTAEKNSPAVLITLVVLALGFVIFIIVSRRARRRNQEQKPAAVNTIEPAFASGTFRQMTEEQKADSLVITIDRFLSTSPHLIRDQQRAEAREIRYEVQGMIYANALDNDKLEELAKRTLTLLKLDHSEYL